MWTYLFNSLAYSALGFLGGAVLAEAGWDIRALIRDSGRRHRDDT
jgi:hypothetical protein